MDGKVVGSFGIGISLFWRMKNGGGRVMIVNCFCICFPLSKVFYGLYWLCVFRSERFRCSCFLH